MLSASRARRCELRGIGRFFPALSNNRNIIQIIPHWRKPFSQRAGDVETKGEGCVRARKIVIYAGWAPSGTSRPKRLKKSTMMPQPGSIVGKKQLERACARFGQYKVLACICALSAKSDQKA